MTSDYIERAASGKHTADTIERLRAENARLRAACSSALDALEGLAMNADTNPWCQELRAALSTPSPNPLDAVWKEVSRAARISLPLDHETQVWQSALMEALSIIESHGGMDPTKREGR